MKSRKAAPKKAKRAAPKAKKTTVKRKPRVEQHRLYERIVERVPVRVEELNATLKAKNLSFDGAFLSTNPKQKKALPLGTLLECTIATSKRDEVVLSAGVVRHESDGVAVVWSAHEAEAALRFAEFLRQFA